MTPSRTASLLAISAFVALAAPVDAGSMCKNDDDFDANAASGHQTLVSCQQMNDHLLSNLGGGSWDDITCDTMVTIRVELGTYGRVCCGSVAKTRCFDSSTMCKVDTDFNGDQAPPNAPTSSPTCAAWSLALLGSFSPPQFSWDAVTCDSIASTVSQAQVEAGNTGLQDLSIGGSSCCGSVAKTRCHDTICKVDDDFTDTSQSGVSIQGTSLTCGGSYGVTRFAMAVFRQAIGNPSLQWSDASCADMTKNLTTYFNRDHYHHLFLKGTMQEFFETYGPICCGSADKTRDPCAASSRHVIKLQVESLRVGLPRGRGARGSGEGRERSERGREKQTRNCERVPWIKPQVTSM